MTKEENLELLHGLMEKLKIARDKKQQDSTDVSSDSEFAKISKDFREELHEFGRTAAMLVVERDSILSKSESNKKLKEAEDNLKRANRHFFNIKRQRKCRWNNKITSSMKSILFSCLGFFVLLQFGDVFPVEMVKTSIEALGIVSLSTGIIMFAYLAPIQKKYKYALKYRDDLTTLVANYQSDDLQQKLDVYYNLTPEENSQLKEIDNLLGNLPLENFSILNHSKLLDENQAPETRESKIIPVANYIRKREKERE